MRRALMLAADALDPTSPNPLVVCVVLDAAGQPAGEGATRPRGGPHAEVVALRAAGGRAGGGTSVVTLEPCNHTGRTRPCVAALIDAGVARVVYAVEDPDSVAGGGASTLRSAGVEVEAGLLAAQAEAINARWLAAMRAQRPFVTWKYAATLDGRVAAADGSSRWITGEAARRETHQMRGRHDAVLVGVGTVLADDPALTARDIEADDVVPSSEPSGPPGPGARPSQGASLRQPLRVVLDSTGRTPATARIRDGGAPTLVLTRDDVPDGDGGLDVRAALKLLWDRHVRSILLEGGPRVAGSFVRVDAVDRVVGYLAPALLGVGPHALGDAGIASITAARRLIVNDVTRVGDDVRVTSHSAGPPTDGDG